MMQHTIVSIKGTARRTCLSNFEIPARAQRNVHARKPVDSTLDEFESPAIGDSGPLSGGLFGTRSVITHLK
jgi:hypothetical protein